MIEASVVLVKSSGLPLRSPWGLLMGLFDRWRLNRAAKAYANRLGPALVASYGAADFYTPAQIRIMVSKLRLNSRYIGLAYAAFLTPAQIDEERPDMPLKLTYEELRELYNAYKPRHVTSASGTPGPIRD